MQRLELINNALNELIEKELTFIQGIKELTLSLGQLKAIHEAAYAQDPHNIPEVTEVYELLKSHYVILINNPFLAHEFTGFNWQTCPEKNILKLEKNQLEDFVSRLNQSFDLENLRKQSSFFERFDSLTYLAAHYDEHQTYFQDVMTKLKDRYNNTIKPTTGQKFLNAINPNKNQTCPPPSLKKEIFSFFSKGTEKQTHSSEKLIENQTFPELSTGEKYFGDRLITPTQRATRYSLALSDIASFFSLLVTTQKKLTEEFNFPTELKKVMKKDCIEAFILTNEHCYYVYYDKSQTLRYEPVQKVTKENNLYERFLADQDIGDNEYITREMNNPIQLKGKSLISLNRVIKDNDLVVPTYVDNLQTMILKTVRKFTILSVEINRIIEEGLNPRESRGLLWSRLGKTTTHEKMQFQLTVTNSEQQPINTLPVSTDLKNTAADYRTVIIRSTEKRRNDNNGLALAQSYQEDFLRKLPSMPPASPSRLKPGELSLSLSFSPDGEFIRNPEAKTVTKKQFREYFNLAAESKKHRKPIPEVFSKNNGHTSSTSSPSESSTSSSSSEEKIPTNHQKITSNEPKTQRQQLPPENFGIKIVPIGSGNSHTEKSSAEKTPQLTQAPSSQDTNTSILDEIRSELEKLKASYENLKLEVLHQYIDDLILCGSTILSDHTENKKLMSYVEEIGLLDLLTQVNNLLNDVNNPNADAAQIDTTKLFESINNLAKIDLEMNGDSISSRPCLTHPSAKPKYLGYTSFGIGATVVGMALLPAAFLFPPFTLPIILASIIFVVLGALILSKINDDQHPHQEPGQLKGKPPTFFNNVKAKNLHDTAEQLGNTIKAQSSLR